MGTNLITIPELRKLSELCFFYFNDFFDGVLNTDNTDFLDLHNFFDLATGSKLVAGL